MVVRALTEGVGVNATARLCGVNKLTVLRLLCDLGKVCNDFHDQHVKNLHPARVQLDEAWGFVGCKERSRKEGKSGHGDA